MSGTLKNGGPAFPQPFWDAKGGSGIVTADEVDAGGMTLRDYFAAKAMQAFIAAEPERQHSFVVAESYEYADEMLKAREA